MIIKVLCLLLLLKKLDTISITIIDIIISMTIIIYLFVYLFVYFCRWRRRSGCVSTGRSPSGRETSSPTRQP